MDTALNRIDELEVENATLRARLAQAEEVMRPFAELDKYYRIYSEECSAARAFLAQGEGELPPADDLPDWEDLRGRAPDATGNLSSEDFVRELRDAWPDHGPPAPQPVEPPAGAEPPGCPTPGWCSCPGPDYRAIAGELLGALVEHYRWSMKYVLSPDQYRCSVLRHDADAAIARARAAGLGGE